MLLVRRFTERAEHRDSTSQTPSLPITFLLVLGIDGLLMGVGFVAGAKECRLLAYALGNESVSLGLATATTVTQTGVPRSRSVGSLIGLAILLLVATIGGATLLHNLLATGLDLLLSFGLAALLFLVIEELLQQAHIVQKPAWLTATF